jgi:hypothetical protein
MSECVIGCWWTGDTLTPLRVSTKLANEKLVVGQRYVAELHEPRSEASERHFFAVLKELWLNLPEGNESRFPDPETLRKFALVATGHCTVNQYVATTKAEAARLCASLEKEAPQYSVVSLNGLVVTVARPLSQSRKAMGKEQFQKSKDDVLGWVGNLVGVSAPRLGPENDALPPTAASSERAADSPPTAAARDLSSKNDDKLRQSDEKTVNSTPDVHRVHSLTRDLAISCLPETDGIEASESGILSTWLRGSAIDFLDEATSIVLAGKNALRAIGHDGRAVFFKIGEAK